MVLSFPALCSLLEGWNNLSHSGVFSTSVWFPAKAGSLQLSYRAFTCPYSDSSVHEHDNSFSTLLWSLLADDWSVSLRGKERSCYWVWTPLNHSSCLIFCYFQIAVSCCNTTVWHVGKRRRWESAKSLGILRLLELVSRRCKGQEWGEK